MSYMFFRVLPLVEIAVRIHITPKKKSGNFIGSVKRLLRNVDGSLKHSTIKPMYSKSVCGEIYGEFLNATICGKNRSPIMTEVKRSSSFPYITTRSKAKKNKSTTRLAILFFLPCFHCMTTALFFWRKLHIVSV